MYVQKFSSRGYVLQTGGVSSGLVHSRSLFCPWCPPPPPPPRYSGSDTLMKQKWAQLDQLQNMTAAPSLYLTSLTLASLCSAYLSSLILHHSIARSISSPLLLHLSLFVLFRLFSSVCLASIILTSLTCSV